MKSKTEAIVDFIDRSIIRIGDTMSVIFAIVVCISFYEVVARYLFNSPTSWVHETSTFLVSLTLLFGGVYVFSMERHISMNFIAQQFSAKTQWVLKMLVYSLTLTFALMLLYGSYLSAVDAFFKPNGKFHMQTSGTILDPPFPAISKAFFCVCCVLFVTVIVLHVARHLGIRKAVFDGTYVAPTQDDTQIPE